MATQQFYTAVSIYDATTQILLGRMASTNKGRCSVRAREAAVSKIKHFVLEAWSRNHFRKRYGITASQFDALLADGAIAPLESFTFKVDEHRPINP